MTAVLKDLQILVTRPALQAEGLCQLIANAGGLPWCFPTLEIMQVTPDAEALSVAMRSDWLLFTSSNAVDFAIKAFSGRIQSGKQPRVAAVGQATAQALRQYGWQVDCVPTVEFSSEGLLAEQAMQHVNGMTCTIVRGKGGREKLADALRSRGASLHYLEVYQRCRPDVSSAELSACVADGLLAAVTITSTEALTNLLAMLEPAFADKLKEIPLVVVSDRIRHFAEQLGFKQIVVSQQPIDSAILETLTTLFNEENSGRSNTRTTRNSCLQTGG